MLIRKLSFTRARRALAMAGAVATLFLAALPVWASVTTCGKTTTDFGGTPSEPDVANAIAMQADGRVVAAGRAMINLPGVGGNAQFALGRYNTDGTLDTSFGPQSAVPGTALVSFFSPPNTNFARAVAVQPSDGKIVTAGLAGPNEQTADAAIARLNPDGSLDTSFGTGGKVLLNISGGLGDGVRALVIQPDGKILAAGAAGPNALLIRLNPDGTLDTSFASTGFLVVNASGLAGSHFFALAQRDDGKIIAAGFAIAASTKIQSFLAIRFNPNGTLDTTFGNSGIATIGFGPLSDLAFGMALTNTGNNGNIVLAGVAQTDPFNVSPLGAIGLAELNPNGSLNTSFGTGGKTTTKISSLNDEALAVVIQPNGKILAIGQSNEASPFPLDPTTGVRTVVRYTSAGVLDPTFGVVTTPFGIGGASARGGVINLSGNLITVGTATVSKPDGTLGMDFTEVCYSLP